MENKKRKYFDHFEMNEEPIKKKLKVKHNKSYLTIIINHFHYYLALFYYKIL